MSCKEDLLLTLNANDSPVQTETDEELSLLLKSCDKMRDYARKYCRHNYFTTDPMRSTENKESCEWYHSFWQFMRILGLVHSPNLLASFYSQFFQAFDKTRDCHILICGTADYAILDHIVRAIPPGLQARTRISILDACRAPLSMCSWYTRWYRREYGVSLDVRYVVGDALQIDTAGEQYDLITTYGFLARFDLEERTELAREWHRVLKPGGVVITSARLTESAGMGRLESDDSMVQQFMSQAMVALDNRPEWSQRKKHALALLAYQYARNKVTYSIPSVEYLQHLFHKFDVRIEYMTLPCALHGLEQYSAIACNKSGPKES